VQHHAESEVHRAVVQQRVSFTTTMHSVQHSGLTEHFMVYDGLWFMAHDVIILAIMLIVELT
jgi:hypothetical protein